MTNISLIDFKPELVSTMKFVLEAASAHLGNSSGKPATPATKAKIAKMASRILKTAADGVTDASKLQSAAIEEGLFPTESGSRCLQKLATPKS